MSDTTAEERGAVAALLEANCERRQSAAAEISAARAELQQLLLRGYESGMGVADMARRAQISRDTAHRILKEAGVMTWKDKQEWAAKVMAHIKKGSYERNEFRMFVNMLLLKALGSKPEGVPQSVEGVLREATETMKTIGGHPGFEPEFDPDVLRLAWPA
jgi:hypothetical protein